MNISIMDKKLSIEMEWFEQLWAVSLSKTFVIPLEHIERVSTENPTSTWTEIRALGTSIPGVIKAGTYYTGNSKEFWYVTRDKDYLVLDLTDELYQKVVLTVDQNQAWVESIMQKKTMD
jgi:hypothetical protein